MSKEGVDLKRRRFLTAAASAVGGTGVAMAVVPFIGAMQPSARTKAVGAPVEADISKIEPGQRVTVKWRGKPVWIVRRTEATLKALPTHDGDLRDPKSEVKTQQPAYADNEWRSIKPEYFVVVGICTHLGCSPLYVPPGAEDDLGPNWQGGFHCPCHGSLFDMAGRVYKDVPAPTNLVVPPYMYLSDTRLLIGADKKGAA